MLYCVFSEGSYVNLSTSSDKLIKNVVEAENNSTRPPYLAAETQHNYPWNNCLYQKCGEDDIDCSSVEKLASNDTTENR